MEVSVYEDYHCPPNHTEVKAKIDNPLLDEFNRICNGGDRGEFGFRTNIIDFVKAHEARRKLTSLYSWAIPDEAALKTIAEYSPIVEMGAGTGYWASLLVQMGVDIIYYDIVPPNEKSNNRYRHATTYHKVEEGGPFEVVAHSDRTLFLCWPPYDTSMAYDCLINYQGNTLIFIGEGDGGCTGDNSFFEELEAHWEMVKEIDIPQWDGLHDYMTIYTRKV